jgi:hypothetical protein
MSPRQHAWHTADLRAANKPDAEVQHVGAVRGDDPGS